MTLLVPIDSFTENDTELNVGVEVTLFDGKSPLLLLLLLLASGILLARSRKIQ